MGDLPTGLTQAIFDRYHDQLVYRVPKPREKAKGDAAEAFEILRRTLAATKRDDGKDAA